MLDLKVINKLTWTWTKLHDDDEIPGSKAVPRWSSNSKTKVNKTHVYNKHLKRKGNFPQLCIRQRALFDTIWLYILYAGNVERGSHKTQRLMGAWKEYYTNIIWH